MKWNTLQSKAYGLDINDFVRDDFLEKLRIEFEDKDVDVVTLQIAVRDKVKDPKNDDAKVDIISLSNRNIEDTLLQKTILDVTSDENFEKNKKSNRRILN
ncbi:hypothetical protein [uncultured Methanobrevibacter sp.]|uniref:hypothetical protein n=1 Tax=uncultured Methanobrevibacter sp. TaxID=253161 RepID=UPI0025DA0BE3|nr:hypothetical protein [uncultured Methanobrevibacter sp.]